MNDNGFTLQSENIGYIPSGMGQEVKMLLIGVRADGNWLLSQWNLTYATGWEGICKAAAKMYDYYDSKEMPVEILADDHLTGAHSKDDIMNIEEASRLTVRGFSTVFKLPLMITFYNQTKTVYVNIAQATEEFAYADYEKFNKSLCQYLDSVEMAMCEQGLYNCGTIQGKEKIRREPDFFVALKNCNSSDNMCALFQKSNGF